MNSITDLETLRYPVGKFQYSDKATAEDIVNWISNIENLPQQIATAIADFSEEQLETPYRPDGWTVRQVVHHLVDSHMNSYIRFKWTLTEDSPTIKAYDEALWAELNDGKNAPVELSVQLLKALHGRWVFMLKNLSEEDLEKYFIHPETGRELTLKLMVALYSWHSQHHLKHITALKERMGWG